MTCGADERSLGEQTVVSASWLIGARLSAKGLDFLTLMILARLLGPADFGLIAMTMTAVLIVEAVTQLPLLQALVRLDDVSDDKFDTAFTLAILRGVIVAVLLLLLAKPISTFFGDTRLYPLISLLAFAPVLRGLVSPGLAHFMRAMDFRQDAALLLIGKFVGTVVACLWAWATGSFWAIAAGTICTPLVMMVLSYRIAPYRPNLGLTAWREFVDIIGWNSLSQLCVATNWQLGQILVGRMTNTASVGLYSMAANIVALPHQALMQPLTRPLVSAFSSAKRSGKVKNGYKQTLHSLILVTAPTFLTISILSDPLIRLILGNEWLPAAVLLRWEAIAALLVIPLAALGPLAMALNMTRFVALRAAAELVLTVPLMLYFIHEFGAIGAVFTHLVVASLMLFLNILIVEKLTKLAVSEQCLMLLRSNASALVLMPILFLLEDFLEQLEGGATLVGGMAFSFLCVLVSYLATALAIWRVTGQEPGIEARMVAWSQRKLIAYQN